MDPHRSQTKTRPKGRDLMLTEEGRGPASLFLTSVVCVQADVHMWVHFSSLDGHIGNEKEELGWFLWERNRKLSSGF